MRRIILCFCLFATYSVSAQNVVEENYLLKNGYELRITNQENDSLLHFILKKDGKTKNIISEYQVYMNDTTLWRKYNSHYDGLDFKNYFGITYFIANSVMGLELYDKATGQDLFKRKCFVLCGKDCDGQKAYDLNEELLLCLQMDDDEDEGNLMLIDLKNQSVKRFPLRSLVKEHHSLYFWYNIYIKNINSKYVTLICEDEQNRISSLKVKRTVLNGKIRVNCKDYKQEIKENRVK